MLSASIMRVVGEAFMAELGTVSAFELLLLIIVVVGGGLGAAFAMSIDVPSSTARFTPLSG